MNDERPLHEYAVEADYTEQRIERFRGNPLIEALPPIATDEELAHALTMNVDFASEQRDWPTEERLLQVGGLINLMVPFEHHIALARTIETMLREGAVGRSPRTAEHIAIFRNNYKKQKARLKVKCNLELARPQMSTALIGVSGVGKTITLMRILSLVPPLIYHPALHFWQVPYLHIETPHDGASVSGLCHAIFRKLDSLIPDANYLETYALRGRPTIPALVSSVIKVLNMHCVGLLILDEIQNLGNAPKSKEELMTLLVSLSNDSHVPVLFVGTNKARKILGLAFRQTRRSMGYGVAYWDRLTKSGNLSASGNWEVFLKALWKNQWIRTAVPLTQALSDLVYYYTQGVPDITVKLFAACQFRAMLDGSETITVALIQSVAGTELRLVEPMITALRNNDLKALALYDDVAPLNLNEMLRDAQIRYEGRSVHGTSIHPGSAEFAPTLATVLNEVGVDPDRAEEIAEAVESSGNAKNAIEGAVEALRALKPPKRAKPRNAKTGDGLGTLDGVDLEPADYRNAIRRAQQEGTTVIAQLEKMGAVCDIESVMSLA